MKKTQLLKAETLGMIAFANGKSCVGAWDKNLMEMIKGRKVSEKPAGEAKISEIFKAWSNGWQKANILAARTIISPNAN